uniref:Wall-associated receptor kinase 1 isoform X1 n=1 Tax=Elaeis guineensis var. tenera TaxID=51953 RepID=A0A6I9R017_ELAGV|nr:wall-associated receptor kinase 1 isoform X1 [Elaeis guineensis]
MISRLLLILELLLLCLAAPFGAYMSEAKNSSFPLTCTNVPYPFGVPGIAMKGFEISCNGTSPILKLGNNSYEIEDISLLQGNLSIYAGTIFHRCNQDFTVAPGNIDLEGTPYTIANTESSNNMLTIVGCNHVVTVQGHPSSYSTSACVSFCDSVDDVIDGSCSGLGCCQFSIPKGLKSFIMWFQFLNLTNRVSNATEIPRCIQAFFVQQNNFTFSSEMLENVVKDNQVSQDRYLMTLDWAIGNTNCTQAKKYVKSYACKENSHCYNSNDGVGYRCNCSQGYHGNPYIECQDINECEDPELNPCVGKCTNKPGSVSCTCPPGQQGDGRKQGSGCTNKAPTVSSKEKEVPLEPALGFLEDTSDRIATDLQLDFFRSTSVFDFE